MNLTKSVGGHVCAAQKCKNKSYNCKKHFFRFPSDPIRAEKWARLSNREDILENIDSLHKSYKLCGDHFDKKMFTNKFCNRLNYNALPTMFASQEGSLRGVPADHSYVSPCLSTVVDLEEPPLKKRRILDVVKITAGFTVIDKKENLRTESQDWGELNFPDANTDSTGNSSLSPKLSSPSSSTQTINIELQLAKEGKIPSY